jgi:hypothetical protein
MTGIPVITLFPKSIHWLNGSADDPDDLCAHSSVEFRIDGETLIRPEDGIWTVSAAALYLLRTLSKSHTKSAPLTEYLFPCCGNSMIEVEGCEDVLIIGCNGGLDFEVVHVGTEICVTAADGSVHQIVGSDWKQAVCQFSDAVHAFYVSASPKRPQDDCDQKGFQKFLSEWTRRRTQAMISIEA